MGKTIPPPPSILNRPNITRFLACNASHKLRYETTQNLKCCLTKIRTFENQPLTLHHFPAINEITRVSNYTTLLILNLKPSANRRQKTLNNCETQNEIVFYIPLCHHETIKSVSLNNVSRIRQTDIQPVSHLKVSCFGIAHKVNKTSSKHSSATPLVGNHVHNHVT